MDVADFFGVRRIEGQFGLEIELEGRNLPVRVPADWTRVHDGSLRGEDNGEFVLRRPLNYEDVDKALKELENTFKAVNAEVDYNRRTSTHVHINCGEMSMTQLFNFITTLIAVEEFLTDWCGEDRVGNLFCLRSSDAEGLIYTIQQFLKDKRKHWFGDGIRYSAINLASLRKYGSLEIRTLRGTLEIGTILQWLRVLQNIQMFAMKPQLTPPDVVMGMSMKGSNDFARTVLGEEYLDFYKGRGKEEKLMEGIRRAQEIAFACDWHTIKWERDDEHVHVPKWLARR